ncbi:hypothetical protein TWF225_004111 [Orbilia oligospora]|uniref:Uncharacterized protein n=1 Tax=Orbilia oligospora TaxID=2813651 RepID=A0A7C8PZ48_ORBOL|nr:hypothetical protein TWF225_004111 [Orbilia oligospora]KAF3184309.1 hypothetical protein TWF751_000284 [Orbilia oligospora]KAF3232555.1 hypothetical protein TWF128_003924 [Orbilia oligospora]KAF3250548.1 hypothetical protein TWF217_008587 [Orbilia oligospora]KAF3286352.1 hypothetical protein TWF132_008923 [Orbilia oligospora]
MTPTDSGTFQALLLPLTRGKKSLTGQKKNRKEKRRNEMEIECKERSNEKELSNRISFNFACLRCEPPFSPKSLPMPRLRLGCMFYSFLPSFAVGEHKKHPQQLLFPNSSQILFQWR